MIKNVYIMSSAAGTETRFVMVHIKQNTKKKIFLCGL